MVKSKFFITYTCFRCEAQWASALLYEECYLCESPEIGELRREELPRDTSLFDQLRQWEAKRLGFKRS